LTTPSLDFETYSAAGYAWNPAANKWFRTDNAKSALEGVGAAVYAEHPSTEIICAAYDLADGGGIRLWFPGAPDPLDLLAYVAAGGILSAFNASFEYQLWNKCAVRRYGWPPLPLAQLRCSMARARAWSIPGNLAGAASVVGGEQKDKRGKQLIGLLSVPRQPTKHDARRRRTRADDPELFAEFGRYCVQDVRTEMDLAARIPELSATESAIYAMDAAINERGVHVDRVTLDAARSVVSQAFDRYTLELQTITAGDVTTAAEIDRILSWCNLRGGYLPNLEADTITTVLKDPGIRPEVRRVLEIRQILGAATVKKLDAIHRQLCADGRLRNLFQYYGAERTGRWAGRGPQPQNVTADGPAVIRCNGCGIYFWTGLARCPKCDRVDGTPAEWNADAAIFARATIRTGDLDTVEQLFGDPLEAVSGIMRGLFCAAPGMDLICSDFSAIEAVVLAELAGESWRQEVFRTHGKIYETSAAAITRIPLDEFTEHRNQWGDHHPKRKLGKVAELASGYGGWIGAWRAFGADEFMSDNEIFQAIIAWRAASPAIVDFWGDQWRQTMAGMRHELYGLEGAAVAAIQNPGIAYKCRSIHYMVQGDVLYCRLPSGRCLAYHTPRLTPGTHRRWGTPIQCISYMGFNSDYKKGPRGWLRLETYGGKLCENIIQAVARDLLAHAMLGLTAAGYGIVLHVHDEIVAEVPEGTGDIAQFETIMSTMPDWAAGWPVRAAGGWVGKRYKKE